MYKLKFGYKGSGKAMKEVVGNHESINSLIAMLTTLQEHKRGNLDKLYMRVFNDGGEVEGEGYVFPALSPVDYDELRKIRPKYRREDG